MNRSTTDSKDAQHKDKQKITREHAIVLLTGLDDVYIHTVKIGPKGCQEHVRDIYKFGLLESYEMVYSTDLYERPDVHRIESPLNGEEVASEIECLVKGVVQGYKSIPGCGLPVEVEYEPAQNMESAGVDNVEGVIRVNVGDQR